MNRLFLPLLAFALAALPLVSGCGKPAGKMSGAVSYASQPIARGEIKFLPDDGEGPTAGGEIANGRYEVGNLVPGKKRVQIVGVKAINFGSREESAAAKGPPPKADKTGIIERADVVPANAQGNNAVIEVTTGQQTHDFDLQPPK